MKKVLALVLSLMLLVSVAFAEEVASVNEDAIACTDSEVVAVADEVSDAVMTLVETVVSTEDLSELLPEEICDAVIDIVGTNVSPDEMMELTIGEVPADVETVTVTFTMASQYAEGTKVAMVLMGLDDEGAMVCAAVVEGVANADGTVTAVIPVTTLTGVQENSAHIALLVLSAAE